MLTIGLVSGARCCGWMHAYCTFAVVIDDSEKLWKHDRPGSQYNHPMRSNIRVYISQSPSQDHDRSSTLKRVQQVYCCGLPLEWKRDAEEYQETIETMRTDIGLGGEANPYQIYLRHCILLHILEIHQTNDCSRLSAKLPLNIIKAAHRNKTESMPAKAAT